MRCQAARESNLQETLAERSLLLASLVVATLVAGSVGPVQANGCCILWVRPIGLDGIKDGRIYVVFDSDGFKQYVLGYDEKNGFPFVPKGYSVRVHVWTSQGLYQAAFKISPDHQSLTNNSVTVPFTLILNATDISCG